MTARNKPLTMLRVVGGAIGGFLLSKIGGSANDEPSPESTRDRELPSGAKEGVVDRAAIEYVVTAGMMAPSGANVQPWKFHFADGVLSLRNDPSRAFKYLDLENMTVWVSLGAVLENIVIAARAIGLEPKITPFPDANDADLGARITFSPRTPVRDELLEWIPKRQANRRKAETRSALPDAVKQKLGEVAAAAGVRVQIKDDEASLAAYDELLRFESRLGFANEGIHSEFTGTFRWTPEEVMTRRDGLDVCTLEVKGPHRAVLHALTDPANVKAIKEANAADFFEKPAAGRITSSDAIVLVTVKGFEPRAVLGAGRAVQRLWTTAQMLGFGVQPQTFLPYYFMRLERAGGEGFDESERKELAEKRVKYRELFEVGPDEAEIFFFRLHRSDAPSARSLRRKLDDLLTIQ